MSILLIDGTLPLQVRGNLKAMAIKRLHSPDLRTGTSPSDEVKDILFVVLYLSAEDVVSMMEAPLKLLEET